MQYNLPRHLIFYFIASIKLIIYCLKSFTLFWLGRVDGFQTFDEPIDCNIEEIRRLLDTNPDDYPDITPPDTDGGA